MRNKESEVSVSGRPFKAYSFMKSYRNLTEVLADHRLASLGDSYINLAYSLALSNRIGKPSGAKVKGSVLADALRKAGLREYLPSRMTRHMLADAAEALIVYAWLNRYVTLEDSVAVLEKGEDQVESLGNLLVMLRNRIIFP